MINFATQSDTDFKSVANLKARESGLADFPEPTIPSDPNKLLPAGGGKWPVPGYQQVVGIVNQAFRSHYYQSGDEAIRHCRANAIACKEDPIISTAAEQRKDAVVQLPWSLEPEDETDPEQMRAAAKNTLALLKTPRWQDMLRAIEDRQWWGKAGVSTVMRWCPHQPDLLKIVDWLPLNGDSLVARWSGGAVLGDWGLMVNGSWDGEVDNSTFGRVHYFTPEEREAVVIGTFKPEAPDFFSTLDTGMIKGRGLRSKVYWYWYLRNNLMAALVDFAERVGNGIWVAYYDQSNPSGRQDTADSIAAYRERQCLLFPRDKDGRTPYGLEIKEPGANSVAILHQIIQYLDSAVRSLILGHPVGDGVQIGVGGDTAVMYSDAVSQVTKLDANSLQDILSDQLVKTLYRYNSPNVPPGRFRFATDHPGASRILEYSQALLNMGYSVDLDAVAKICGVPKAAAGATIGTKVQSVNPVAIQSPPIGVPQAQATPQAPQQAPTEQAGAETQQ